MRGPSFLDTNILVYTDDRDRRHRQRRALDFASDCLRRRTPVSHRLRGHQIACRKAMASVWPDLALAWRPGLQ
jgi:predicted nucleic acid-binding protein